MEFSKRDTKVMKGIAVILMLYHHLFAFADRIPDGSSYVSLLSLSGKPAAFWIGDFGKLCVMLFVFLGGYGTYLSSRSVESLSAFVADRVKHLYIVYWEVFFLFIPVCMYFNVSRVVKDIRVFVGNFSGMNITYNGEWWFFTPYILLMVLFPLIKKYLSYADEPVMDILTILSISLLARYITPVLMHCPGGRKIVESFLLKKLTSVLNLLPGFLLGCVCAKYNLLTKVKEKVKDNPVAILAAILILFSVFDMRKKTRGIYDFVYAPIVTSASIIILRNKWFAILYNLLEKIGKESTIIWLTHSFYCYLLCPVLIYKPHFSILIVIWLCFLSYMTSIGIHVFYNTLKSLLVKHIIIRRS